jgi:hypothetical protein
MGEERNRGRERNGLDCNGGREKNRDRDLREEDANFYRVYKLPINPRTDH